MADAEEIMGREGARFRQVPRPESSSSHQRVEPFARTAEARADRTDRDVELLGRFLVRTAFDRDKTDDFTLARSQAVEGTVHITENQPGDLGGLDRHGMVPKLDLGDVLVALQI